MPLRLAGEYDTINGLDALGWLREIDASASSDPALKLTPGTGPALSVEQNNVSALRQLIAAGGAYRSLKLNASDRWEVDADLALAEKDITDVAQIIGRTTSALNISAGTNRSIRLSANNQVDANMDIASAGPMLLKRLDVNGQVIQNLAAGHNGAVAIDDRSRLAGIVEVYKAGELDGVQRVTIRPDFHDVRLYERTTHLANSEVDEDYGSLYVYNDGAGTRQLVVKYKDGGTVYTGTLSLT